MKRPVFSFRPNMKEPNHRKAWAILNNVPEGEKTAYLVGAILAFDQGVNLEEMVRRAVREEMASRNLVADRKQSELQEPDEIPEEMFEFLSALQEE